MTRNRSLYMFGMNMIFFQSVESVHAELDALMYVCMHACVHGHRMLTVHT
jgi:hypothetical protein